MAPVEGRRPCSREGAKVGPALTSARLSIHTVSDSDALPDPLPKSHLGSWLNADSWDWAQMDRIRISGVGPGNLHFKADIPLLFPTPALVGRHPEIWELSCSPSSCISPLGFKPSPALLGGWEAMSGLVPEGQGGVLGLVSPLS